MTGGAGGEKAGKGAAIASPWPLRVGCIDIGSNAMRCVAVEARGPHAIETILQERAPIRLGHSVFLDGSIDSTTLDEAVRVLGQFRGMLDKLDVTHVRCVATSAVREATNAKTFVRRAKREAGIDVETITGAEEARLLHLAVAQRMPLDGKPWMFVDVGGGSVEVSVGDRTGLAWSESHPMGAVRLLEEFHAVGSQREKARRLIEETVGTLRIPGYKGDGLSGLAATGGNIEEVARILDEKEGGKDGNGKDGGKEGKGRERVTVVSVKAMASLLKEMHKLSPDERAEKWRLKGDRADVIVPAGMIYEQVARLAKLDAIHVPNVGLKDGVIADLVLEAGAASTLRPERVAVDSALSLGRRYAFDEAHGLQVERLAMMLFDQLQDLHGLGPRDRSILAAAAVLHDVGRYIADRKHHKHSYYLISQSEIPGLTDEETELAAQVARYHRRSEPKPSHEPFGRLGNPERDRVVRMSGLLRVADALDRQHKSIVRSVTCRREKGILALDCDTDADCLLEQWAVDNKGALLERVLGLRPVVRSPSLTREVPA